MQALQVHQEIVGTKGVLAFQDYLVRMDIERKYWSTGDASMQGRIQGRGFGG